MVAAGHMADPASIDKLERFRVAWESFFASATGRRMTVDTRLR